MCAAVRRASWIFARDAVCSRGLCSEFVFEFVELAAGLAWPERAQGCGSLGTSCGSPDREATTDPVAHQEDMIAIRTARCGIYYGELTTTPLLVTHVVKQCAHWPTPARCASAAAHYCGTGCQHRVCVRMRSCDVHVVAPTATDKSAYKKPVSQPRNAYAQFVRMHYKIAYALH